MPAGPFQSVIHSTVSILTNRTKGHYIMVVANCNGNGRPVHLAGHFFLSSTRPAVEVVHPTTTTATPTTTTTATATTTTTKTTTTGSDDPRMDPAAVVDPHNIYVYQQQRFPFL
jgi:hypothetical protein